MVVASRADARHTITGNDATLPAKEPTRTMKSYPPDPDMVAGSSVSGQDARPNVAALDTARNVVQSILTQITLHDSPPINEGTCSPKSKHRGIDRLIQKSLACQQPAQDTFAALSSSDSSMTSSETSTLHSGNDEAVAQWRAQYNQRKKQVEMKMGHGALATLCQRTLDCTAPRENQENVAPPPPRPKPSLRIDTTSLTSARQMDEEFDRPPALGESLMPLSPLVGLSLDTNRPSFGDPPALDFTVHSLNDAGNNLPTPVSIRENDDLRRTPSDDSPPVMERRPSKDPPLVPCRDPSPTFAREATDHFEPDLVIGACLSMEDDALNSPPNYPDIMPARLVSDLEPVYSAFVDPIHNLRLSALNQRPRLQMFGSEYARFLSETPLAPKQRKTTMQKLHRPPRNSRPHTFTGKESGRIFNLENASQEIVTGAITDIIVTRGAMLPPKGYYRISQTHFGDDFGGLERKGREIHINVKKEPKWDRAAQRPCVTAITVIFPERKEVVPPGFCVVSLYDGKAITRHSVSSEANPADLNLGMCAERIYLCYRRSREGNPLTGLMPLLPSKFDPIPEGYTVLERSPRNHVADLNSGGNYSVFLAFRQRLASLEPLRPLPLLLSVYHDAIRTRGSAPSNADRQQYLESTFRKATLRSYYCTGGTTVASQVGTFHIMDRSTHALLSPSSISNRLALIQASRQKAGSADGASTASSSLGVQNSLYLDGNLSVTNTMSGSNSIQTNPGEGDDIDDGSLGDTNSINNAIHIVPTQRIRKVAFSTLFSQDDIALKYCLSATAFIPVVELPPHDQIDHELTLDVRTAIITPILTACYTQHGGAALLAVQGLDTLLKKTSFFRPDVVAFPNGEGSEGRLTLLDITIQSVCDIATSSARETSFVHCVDFVNEAVDFAQGHLNARTIGYVLRFYLFVFYFGASVPTSSKAPNTVWPTLATDGHSTRSVVAAADVPFLFEVEGSNYLPGGAPQAAALALKNLVTLIMNKLAVLSSSAKTSFVQLVKGSTASSSGEEDPMGNFVDGVIASLVDNAVRRVDLANFTQLALHQIHRSGGSELFWYDMMTSCGSGLFGSIDNLGHEGKSIHMVAFSLLANIVKVCSGRMRHIPSTGALIPRDVASKMLSLEILRHYIASFRRCATKARLLDNVEWIGPQKESSETLIYAMRRLVVPCLLTNTIQGLQDARVFRRLVHIISEAWMTPIFRQRMKLELGVLIEQFALRLLNLGPQLLSPDQMNSLYNVGSDSVEPLDPGLQIFTEPLFKQQVDLLFEVNRWFQGDARSLVEFFLNFDTDISLQNEGSNYWMPGSQWKLCERLTASICLVAEKSGNVIGNQIKESHETNQGPLTPTSADASDVSKQNPRNGNDKDSLWTDTEATMVGTRVAARHLQQHSFLAAAQIARCLALAAATSAGREEAKIVSRKNTDEKEIDLGDDEYAPIRHSDRVSTGSREGDDTILSYWRTAIAAERKRGPASRRNGFHRRNQSHGSHRAGVGSGNEWDHASVATDGPTDETLKAAFRIVEATSLKKGIEYLIEQNFLSPSPRNVATFLRVHHSRLNSKSLGEYLGEGGFDDASIEYFNLVRFNYVRAISFVGMTVEQGLRHFLTNSGFRLPGEAQQIDRVMTTFAQCYWEDNAGDYYRCPFDDQDTVFLLSFAIIMLNTDLHKQSLPSKYRSRKQRKRMTKVEFLNNLRDVARDDALSQEYLSSIYDSVEAFPIVLFEESKVPVLEITTSTGISNVATEYGNLGQNLKSIMKNVKKSEELLRGLSVHEFRFYTIEDYAEYMSCSKIEALMDLSNSAFACTWNHFHGLIKATVKIAHLDPQALVLCLPLLRHCLCATICFDMMKEFQSFSLHLARIKAFADKSTTDAPSFRTEEWFSDLQAALEDNDRVTALEQIQELMEELEERLKVDSTARKQMSRVVRRIREGQFLLNDPTRSFCKEGCLLKKSHRMGRSTKYHFFLFSDLLIYAKPISVFPGEDVYYLIHEVLSLPTMKVVDWYSGGMNKKNTEKNFTIHHPRKSFTVVCSTVKERKEWVMAIRKWIRESHRRMVMLEQERKNNAEPPVPAELSIRANDLKSLRG